MLAVKKYRALLIALIAWVAVAPPTRAQFICTVTSENLPKNLNGGDALSCIGNNCFATGGYHDYIRFLRSVDGGYTWAVQDPGVPIDTFGGIAGIDMIDSANIVAYGISGHIPFALIIRTSDGGVKWQQESVPTGDQINGLSFSSPMDGILVVAGDGTFITSDGGDHWDTIPVVRGPQFQGKPCHAYGNGKYRIFKYGSGEIYTTTDHALTFDSTGPIFSDPSERSQHIFVFCSFGSGDTMLAYGYHGATPCIARTSDAGRHWSSVYDDTTGISGEAVSLSDVNRDTIVAAISGGPDDVLWSKDNGITWEVDSLICTDTNFDGYQNDGIGLNSEGNLVGAFNSHVISGQKVKTSLIIGQRVSSLVPLNGTILSTLQVSPNPAITSVTITGASAGRALHLLDILGREVLHAKVPPGGSLTLNIASLPPGLYYISDGSTQAKFVME